LLVGLRQELDDPAEEFFIDVECHISNLFKKRGNLIPGDSAKYRRSEGTNWEQVGAYTLLEFWRDCSKRIFGRIPSKAELKTLWPKLRFLLIPINIHNKHWVRFAAFFIWIGYCKLLEDWPPRPLLAIWPLGQLFGCLQ